MDPDPLISHLVLRIPVLERMLDQHVADCGELLPDVFMAELSVAATEWFLASRGARERAHPELDQLLQALESAFASTPASRELIAGSFLENLPGPHEPGHEITALLGPELTAELRRLRTDHPADDASQRGNAGSSSSMRPKPLLWLERIAVVLIGAASIVVPTALDEGRTRYDSPLLPIMRECMENLTWPRTLMLLYVGIPVGFLTRLVWPTASILMAAGFVIWSGVDALAGGDHSLLPIEWIVYAGMAVVAAAGVGIGKTVRWLVGLPVFDA